MMLHHLLDIMNGKKRGFCAGPREAHAEFCSLIKKADLFDFGDLHFVKEEDAPTGYQAFDIPQLTPIEQGFWDDGLIPMPSALCWFEFRLVHRCGLFIRYDGPKDLRVQRVDYLDDLSNVSGVWSRRLEGDKDDYELTAISENCLRTAQSKYDYTTKLQQFAVPLKLAMYLALMLNSKTTEVRMAERAPKLDKARARVGKCVLPSHRIVTIVPHRFRSERGDGHHASPMLHWRRSHIRRYGNGKTVLIPRHLVGHRELGTLSHEYRFKSVVDKSGAVT